MSVLASGLGVNNRGSASNAAGRDWSLVMCVLEIWGLEFVPFCCLVRYLMCFVTWAVPIVVVVV